MDVELFQVPNDSSEANAKRIADHVREKMQEDARKYIVVGYSKGAPDVQVALAQEPGMASAVAAFVSVAGAVGGSPVIDVLPASIQSWTSKLKLGSAIATWRAFRGWPRSSRIESPRPDTNRYPTPDAW